MKTQNLRVDNPAVRIKYEFNGVLQLNEILGQGVMKQFGEHTELAANPLMIKVKTVTFRASGNTVVGEQPVLAFSRKYFAMFKTNSFVASISTVGTIFDQWMPATSLSLTEVIDVISADVTNKITFGSDNEDITTVVTFDVIGVERRN